MEQKWVYSFGNGSAEGKAEMRELLGGKGANLAEMSNLGLAVPPGFTISTDVCAHYTSNQNQYPKALEEQVNYALKQIEKDKEYISEYAKQYPKSEDVAESIVAWIAVRYRLDRISNGNAEIILKTIPNRLKFFDEQNFDMYPLVPRE